MSRLHRRLFTSTLIVIVLFSVASLDRLWAQDASTDDAIVAELTSCLDRIAAGSSSPSEGQPQLVLDDWRQVYLYQARIPERFDELAAAIRSGTIAAPLDPLATPDNALPTDVLIGAGYSPERTYEHGNRFKLAEAGGADGQDRGPLDRLRLAELLTAYSQLHANGSWAGGLSMWERFEHGSNSSYLETSVDEAIAAAETSLERLFATPDEGRVAVFNPLGFERSEFAEVPVAGRGPWVVRDVATGREVASQLVERDGATYLRFAAGAVPSLGYRVFRYEAGVPMAMVDAATVNIVTRTIENSRHRVELGQRGEITATDKLKGNRRLVDENDWNVGRGAIQSVVAENVGPVSATLRVELTEPSRTVSVTLYSDVEWVDVAESGSNLVVLHRFAGQGDPMRTSLARQSPLHAVELLRNQSGPFEDTTGSLLSVDASDLVRTAFSTAGDADADSRGVECVGTVHQAANVTVNSSGERGMLGIAFPASYDGTGPNTDYVYLYYTATGPTHNRISRFTVTGAGTATPSLSAELVLRDLPSASATNHNGGAAHFGIDGKLYVAVGDHASSGSQATHVSQRLDTPFGKILRINPDGTNPGDNMFDDGNPLSWTGAIFALGLRNPFTFAFEPGTGRMFINDVGQSAWEEINEGISGANYGWAGTSAPVWEGFENPPPPWANYQDPLMAYDHNNSAPTPFGCSIAGGAFYPANSQFGAAFAGKYFFADFCGNFIRVFDPDNPGTVGTPDTSTGFASSLDSSSPIDLKVDSAGSLYYLGRNGGIRRISFTPPSKTAHDKALLTTLPAGFTDTLVNNTGISNGTAFDFSPVGELWVLEQSGRVLSVLTDAVCSACGNGVVESPEVCDDGNTVGGDGCSADCSSDETCGNSIVDPGETCDDGNTTSNDGCDANCNTEFCGDGIVQSGLGEVCDDGNTAGGDGCSADCTSDETCGNGIVDPGEQCDDGNMNDVDACSNSCVVNVGVNRLVNGDFSGGTAPWVFTTTGGGSYQVVSGEAKLTFTTSGLLVTFHQDNIAVDSNTQYTLSFRARHSLPGRKIDVSFLKQTSPFTSYGLASQPFILTTAMQTFSVDFTTTAGAINDGRLRFNLVSAAAPASMLWIDDVVLAQTSPPVCGNGTVEAGEQCDDGNTAGGDGCDSSCQIEPPVCGNGTVETGEECDDGNTANGDGCDSSCQNEPVCGNGTVETGEQCDDGNTANGDGCSSTCQIEAPVCGNGIVEAGEQCDDGNTANGDGCSSTCQNEGGPNLVVNGDFAGGTLPWRYTHSNGSSDYSVVGGEAFIDIATQSANGQLWQDGITLQPNTTYRLTFDARNTGGDNVRARVIRHTSPYTQYGSQVTDLTTTMQTHSFTFTTPGSVAEARVQFYIGPYDSANDDYFFDNVILALDSPAVCGNGTVEGGEQCDDGNTANGDGCDSTCQNEPVCGNGTVESGEQCDDGNTANGDGCSSTCQVEAPVCGNGIVESGEQCDDGNTANGDGCSSTCQNEGGGSNLLVNGNFSSGPLPWRYTHSNGSSTYSVVGGEAFIDIATPSTNGQLWQNGVTLQPNTTYRVTFRARNTAGSNVRARVIRHTSPYTQYGSSVINLTTTMQTYTFTFTTPGSVATARMQFYIGPYDTANGDYFFDDVVLEVD